MLGPISPAPPFSPCKISKLLYHLKPAWLSVARNDMTSETHLNLSSVLHHPCESPGTKEFQQNNDYNWLNEKHHYDNLQSLYHSK